MKKTIFTLTVIAALLFSVNLNAQNKSGIKAGFINSISTNVVPEASYLPNWYVAGFHERTIGESKVFWMYNGTEYLRTGWLTITSSLITLTFRMPLN